MKEIIETALNTARPLIYIYHSKHTLTLTKTLAWKLRGGGGEGHVHPFKYKDVQYINNEQVSKVFRKKFLLKHA